VIIDEPGVYRMPATEYHADPAPTPSLSAGIANRFVNESPLHAWWSHRRLNPDFHEQESNRLSLGTLCHTLLLGEGRDVAVFDGSNWQKKEAREFRAAALAEGKTPVTTPQYERCMSVVEAARSQLAGLCDGCEPEQVWLAHEGPALWVRCMTDWYDAQQKIVYDYKTTAVSAEPFGAVPRQVANLDYDFKQAFYERVMTRVHPSLDGRLRFRFIFQEIDAPYALSIVELDEASIEVSRRRVAQAVRDWGQCIRRDQWPGYPLGPHRVQLPEWRLRTLLNDELGGDDDAL